MDVIHNHTLCIFESQTEMECLIYISKTIDALPRNISQHFLKKLEQIKNNPSSFSTKNNES